MDRFRIMEPVFFYKTPMPLYRLDSLVPDILTQSPTHLSSRPSEASGGICLLWLRIVIWKF